MNISHIEGEEKLVILYTMCFKKATLSALDSGLVVGTSRLVAQWRAGLWDPADPLRIS